MCKLGMDSVSEVLSLGKLKLTITMLGVILYGQTLFVQYVFISVSNKHRVQKGLAIDMYFSSPRFSQCVSCLT